MLNLHCLSTIKKSTEFQSLNVSELKLDSFQDVEKKKNVTMLKLKEELFIH